MSRRVTRVQGLNPDGTATLEDGRVMQLVMSDTGALGLRAQTNDDRLAQLDQYIPSGPPGMEPIVAPLPSIASLGLDQA